jgi:hypothetical protein
MAHKQLRATPAQLCDALGACAELKPIYRRMLKMFLEELQLIEQQISQLDQELATLLSRHQDAVKHLALVPGLGVDSAQQIIAEVGAQAVTFPSAKQLASWVGACPGDEESAGVSKTHRSPSGNRHMRRILNQAANAAAKSKGTIFEIAYRRLLSRLGHNQTIGANRISSLATSRFTKRSASGKSFLRPRRPRFDCACAKCSTPEVGPMPSRFWQTGFQYRSSAPHTGTQYCAVDSITTSSTCRSISHSTSSSRCSGLLP